MTRLSRIHPYPAMIADELAAELAQQFTKPGSRVLDPFCGTGRTLLAAAERGAKCVGVDVNPLATLLTRAKSSNPKIGVLEQFMDRISDCQIGESAIRIRDFEFGRKVIWFPRKSKMELSALIERINAANLNKKELVFVGAILSATAREVSFCRQDGWKLHRISQNLRKGFLPSALKVFRRRLRAALGELRVASHIQASPRIITGDARYLSRVLGAAKESKPFDVVITSPPYGDSRTTVQYGAMSALCLGVLRHLHGFNFEILRGGDIDARCLGGTFSRRGTSGAGTVVCPSRYWHGGVHNSARQIVERYLLDVELCCREISKLLRRDGKAIFIVARRSVGGWRLNLDQFLIDTFLRWKITLEGKSVRKIEGKAVPYFINKLGRILKKAKPSDRVSTMRVEYVLAFRKM
jgi:site-specific DNA-methyltransferase (cytosine-N4-specific)